MRYLITIFKRKKFFLDIALAVISSIFILLGFFVSIDKLFSFASGIDIGPNVQNAVGRGVSIVDIINNSDAATQQQFNSLMDIIILILLIIFVLSIAYYIKLPTFSKQNIYFLEGIKLFFWLLLAIAFGNIFDLAVRKMDYLTLRVYGVALFGIIGLLVIILSLIIEAIIFAYSYTKDKSVLSTEQIVQSTEQVPSTQLTGGTKTIYYVIFGIMLIQNISFFPYQTLLYAVFIDFIGIIVLTIMSFYQSFATKNRTYLFGAISLFIWLLITFTWRDAAGLFGGPGLPIGPGSSGTDTALRAIIFFIAIGSFFLGAGLYFSLKEIFSNKVRVQQIILFYGIVNIISSFLLLASTSLGLYAKLYGVPAVAIVMYLMGIYELHISGQNTGIISSNQNLNVLKDD